MIWGVRAPGPRPRDPNPGPGFGLRGPTPQGGWNQGTLESGSGPRPGGGPSFRLGETVPRTRFTPSAPDRRSGDPNRTNMDPNRIIWGPSVGFAPLKSISLPTLKSWVDLGLAVSCHILI